MVATGVGGRHHAGRRRIGRNGRATDGHTLPMPALWMRQVTKSFRGFRALDAVDLTVSAGQVVGLVGPNGSGKSTTIRCVTGLTKPDRGLMRIAGSPVGTAAARARVTLVPDHPSGFDELTIGEFLKLYASLYSYPSGFDERSEKLLDSFGLDRRRRHYLKSLSTGMRRQVSMVAALSVGADLVVIDEAAATLDPEAVVVLREAVAAVARNGSAVLLATQDLHFAERACTDFCFLSDGRIVRTGSYEDIVAAEARRQGRPVSLEEIFLSSLGHGRLISDLRRDLADL